MQTSEILAPAASAAPEPEPFDLGQWLGRHQALACIAHYCSAADARALETIRERKLYRALNVTWDDFCAQYAGVSRATANRIIENLEEFGDAYFKLSQILKIPASEYRALQPAVDGATLEFDGRRIPIDRENAAELIEAVRTLRGRLESERRKAAQSSMSVLQAQLDRMVGQISGALRRTEEKDRGILMFMIEDFITRAVESARRVLGETGSAADAVSNDDAA